MNSVLVTGGSGFIGSYFLPQLSRRGLRAVNLDLVPPDPELAGFPFVQGDVRDPHAVAAAMEGCDAALHLAAAHHDFGISEQTFYGVNETGARVLCQAMDKRRVREVCFFSTVAVYGAAPPPLTEETTPEPESFYGKSKLAGERVFEEWVAQGDGRRCLVIRPTVTFGPRNFANLYKLIRQVDQGRFLPVGRGTNIKSLSYVENIVDATLYLWQDQPELWSGLEVYNWIDKPDLSSKEITQTIYEALGKRMPSFSVPYPLAVAAALPFDLVIALTGKDLPVSSARIQKLAVAQTKFESDKVLATGFQPQLELREGLKKMVEWYLQTGKQQQARKNLPPEQVASQNA